MKTTGQGSKHSLVEELSLASLGDRRRTERYARIVARAMEKPNEGFPTMAGSDSELEGFYRFFGNERLKLEQLLEPHYEATVQRASVAGCALAVHDTTYFEFGGDREGLGRLTLKGGHGFWGHFTLMADLSGHALGVMNIAHGVRQGPAKWKGSKPVKGVSDEPGARESERWVESVDAVRARTKGKVPEVVHVMDREGDWYRLLSHLQQNEDRFVIRVSHDRALVASTSGEATRLSGALSDLELMAEREVPLSPRGKQPRPASAKRIHPAREGRRAMLGIRACSVQLRAPQGQAPASLRVNVVHVLETNAPDGAPPVDWKLMTCEPIDTAEQVLRIVDIYRRRWVIEEYFKSLKTGCAFEKRQLESMQALLIALAVLAPVAWHLLTVRDFGRKHPNAPAKTVLTPTQLLVLQKIARRPLPADPTANDIQFAIAALGGHLRRNGPPGWQTLGKGHYELLTAVAHYHLFRRSDQS